MTELCLVLWAETLFHEMFLFLVYSILHMQLISVGNAQITCSHVTPPWGLLLYAFPSRSSSSSSSLLTPLSSAFSAGSAGLNVSRDALLKACGPISLVQMHTVSLKFHANRHVLFKQLWGYPQEEACLPLLVMLVSSSWNHQSHDVQDGTEWLGQHTNIRNILAAIFTLFQMCFSSFYVTENGKLTSIWANADIIFYILSTYVHNSCELRCMYAENMLTIH